jgi:Rps23 Pro-64 3,4-dihydroxylase Tpa1-like proline 4-hydroxylase
MTAELAAAYPKENFIKSIRNAGDKKHYHLNILPIIDSNLYTKEFEIIPAIWRQFISTITSAAYIKKIFHLGNVSEFPYDINVGFYTFSHGGWISPHIDNPGKIFTQIFYFNSFWDVYWGGKLNILTSENPEDVIISVPPLSCFTATVFRSKKAWHMVEPVIPKDVTRLSLQLEILEKKT